MNTKNNKKYLIKCIILLIIAFICLFQTILINALEAQPNEQRPNNQHYAFTQSPDKYIILLLFSLYIYILYYLNKVLVNTKI